MNFPNLNFEIQYFQDFLNSESKLGWLRQSFFDGNQNAELQLSILALFVVIGVVLVHMFTNYGDLPKAKYRKIQIIKIIVSPISVVLGYYSLKLMVIYIMWTMTLGWWLIPFLIIQGIAVIVIVALYVKFVDKRKAKK
jgi:predicted ferric reductase